MCFALNVVSHWAQKDADFENEKLIDDYGYSQGRPPFAIHVKTLVILSFIAYDTFFPLFLDAQLAYRFCVFVLFS